jgi:hypothetical protein
MAITQTTREFVRDVFFLHPLAQLQPSTADLVRDLIVGLGLKVEKIGEEIEVWFYS